MRGSSRRFLLGVVALALATLALSSGVAQLGQDPRNESTEYYDAVNGGNCMAHHEGDNLEPMVFRISEGYSMVPIGEIVQLELTIAHFKTVTRDTVTQDMMDMFVTVDKTNAPDIDIITEDFVEDVENTRTETVASGQTAEFPLEVEEGAVSVLVRATKTASDQIGSAAGDRISLAITAPNSGTTFSGEGPPAEKTVSLDEGMIAEAGGGPYNVRVGYEHPVQQVATPATIDVYYEVKYAQTQTVFRFEVPGGAIRGADPVETQTRTVIIPIRANSDAEGILDFRAEVVNFWAHQPGDGAPRDDGLFYRFTTLRVGGGDQLIRVDSVNAPVPLGPTVDLYNLFTRVMGFVAVVLVPLAMVTGGVFGKGSRRWLNRLTGGAKKRVLWHNAMSFIIIGVASTHFLFALLEAQFLWTKGLFWGGVGWALLVSLGFTGYYQVRMIKRWNYRVWRHTHLWSAVAVLTFGLVHTALDGSDLDFVREVLPSWHEWLIWP